MIKDKIENSKIYYNLSDGIAEGLKWIEKNNLKDMKENKYILTNGLYANLETYEPREDALYEAHRKYIDIQYMIKGSEKCEVCDYAKTSNSNGYDSEKDIEFMRGKGDTYTLEEGEFFIFFPNDAHKPALKNKDCLTVKKVVVKVPV